MECAGEHGRDKESYFMKGNPSPVYTPIDSALKIMNLLPVLYRPCRKVPRAGRRSMCAKRDSEDPYCSLLRDLTAEIRPLDNPRLADDELLLTSSPEMFLPGRIRRGEGLHLRPTR